MNSSVENNGVYREQAPLSYDNGSRESMKVQCNKCGEVYSANELRLHIKLAHGNDSSNVEDETTTDASPSLQNSGIKGQRKRRGRPVKEISENNDSSFTEDQITEGLAKMDISRSAGTVTQRFRCNLCRFECIIEEMKQHFNTLHCGCEVQVEKVPATGGVDNGSVKPRQVSRRKNKKGGSKGDTELMEVCKICHRKYERKFAAMHYKLMHSEVKLDEGFGQLEASPRMRLGQRKTLGNAPKSDPADEENQFSSQSHANESTSTPPSTTIKKLNRRSNRKKMTAQGKSLETCSICQHHYLISFASFHYKIMHPEISFTEEMEKMDSLSMSTEDPRQRSDSNEATQDLKEETGNQQSIKGRLSKKKKRRKLSSLHSEAFELCTLCDKKYDKQFAALHFEMMHGGVAAAKPAAVDSQAMDNGTSGGGYNTFEDSSNSPSTVNYEPYGQDTSSYEQNNSNKTRCGICNVNINRSEIDMHYVTAHHGVVANIA